MQNELRVEKRGTHNLIPTRQETSRYTYLVRIVREGHQSPRRVIVLPPPITRSQFMDMIMNKTSVVCSMTNPICSCVLVSQNELETAMREQRLR